MEPSSSDQGPRRYRIADYAVPPARPAARRPLWRALRGILQIGFWKQNPHTSPPAPRRRALRLILQIGCWLYAAGVMLLWAAVNWIFPESWVSHFLLYGPRWTVAAPALLLVPAVIWMRSRWAAIAVGIALTSFLGIWGFNVPWRNLLPDNGPSRPRLRLLTCNVQGNDLKIPVLAEIVRETQPDIVLLQECRLEDPSVIFGHEDWYIRTADEFFVASRHPIEGFETLTRPDRQDRIVAVRANVSWHDTTIPIVSVHLMTPRSGLEAIIEKGWRGVDAFREIAEVQQFESDLVRRWVEEWPGSIILAGDFNLTTEHAFFRHDWSDYTDAFVRTRWGLGHTMRTRWIGLRIDHILCGADWQPTRCGVVSTALGSAHRALVADLLLDSIP